MIVVIQEDNVDCDDDDIIIHVIFNDNECKWLVLHFIASQLHSCTVDALKCGGLYKHSLSLNMTRITYIIIINCKLSTMVVHVLASISKSDFDHSNQSRTLKSTPNWNKVKLRSILTANNSATYYICYY